MKIALLNLRWCKYGGWPSYAKHLSHALKAVNVQHDVLSLESPTGAYDWVTKITKKELENLSKNYDLVHIITLSKDIKEILPILYKLEPLAITMHDPTELFDTVKDLLFFHPKYLKIHDRMANMKISEMKVTKYGIYIPQPYKRESGGIITGKRIISLSRIDHDKHTEIILQANCGIEVWSGYINRIYDYHTLRKIIPGGIKSYPLYKGEFKSPKEVCPGSCALIDLSTLSGVGGGTLYTTLEAMDYGLTLISRSDWYFPNEECNELKKGFNYIPITTAEDLKKEVNKLTKTPLKKLDNRNLYKEIMTAHDHKTIGEEYKRIYTQWIEGKHEQFAFKHGLRAWRKG